MGLLNTLLAVWTELLRFIMFIEKSYEILLLKYLHTNYMNATLTTKI